jgi:hypothetical protein
MDVYIPRNKGQQYLSISNMAMFQIERSVQRITTDFQPTITHLNPDKADRQLRESRNSKQEDTGVAMAKSSIFAKHLITKTKAAEHDATSLSHGSG